MCLLEGRTATFTKQCRRGFLEKTSGKGFSRFAWLELLSIKREPSFWKSIRNPAHLPLEIYTFMIVLVKESTHRNAGAFFRACNKDTPPLGQT